MMTTTVGPVRKTLELTCSPRHAFEVFTTRIHEWWPLASYSIGGEHAATAVFEARAGGRIYEVADDGTESLWGTVLACEPPARLLWTWHPGGDAARATEVEVRFSPTATGTRFELEHRNWDLLGDRGHAVRENYQSGWDTVLAPFRAAT